MKIWVSGPGLTVKAELRQVPKKGQAFPWRILSQWRNNNRKIFILYIHRSKSNPKKHYLCVINTSMIYDGSTSCVSLVICYILNRYRAPRNVILPLKRSSGFVVLRFANWQMSVIDYSVGLMCSWSLNKMLQFEKCHHCHMILYILPKDGCMRSTLGLVANQEWGKVCMLLLSEGKTITVCDQELTYSYVGPYFLE